MSLQNDHRPKTFKDLIGNQEIKESLTKVLHRENPPSAFLFTGPSGSGKTTIARIIKKELKCSGTDWKELNTADDRGIESIRRLIETMRFAPLKGKKKIFFLDEAHMLTKPSQEALLKALEEPPNHVHWIICTTNPEALKITFKRRCHTYELSPLLQADLQKLFSVVLKKEDRENISSDVLDKIIELSDGSAGQALKLLDMVIDMEASDRALKTLESVGQGSEGDVTQIVKILSHRTMPTKTKWSKISKILKDYKGDGETHRRLILGYLSAILINGGGDDIFFMMQPFKKNFFDSGKAGLVSACYEAIFGGE